MAPFEDLAKLCCRVPEGGEKVFKDECVYCFQTPKCENGLYICLATFIGVCKNHIALHLQRTSNTLFLKIQQVEIEVEELPTDQPKPTKMAFGVEGGFDVDKNKKTYSDHNALVIANLSNDLQLEEIPLPNPSLPLNVQLSIAGILSHKGAEHIDNVEAWEEKRLVSKHADSLKQIENGIKIPPSGWKCSRCDLTQNLWLNLTDGTILCGRRYYDGSGGNNHALEYYEETKFPLAVKLGTITAVGGDVYSYDEDDMVIDPKLKEHLKHFGINIEQLEKTDKTMTELEIEANLSIKAEWDLIQEAGKKLKPMFGPGYTGMVNLANSCYMNSVMQVLFSMEEFKQAYFTNKQKLFELYLNDPARDFNIQMAKLADGLLSGDYSKQPESENEESIGIRAGMIKSLIGQGHVEFSTNCQQDAQEYFLHLLEMIGKHEKSIHAKLNELFAFQLEDRLECMSSHKVSYKKREDFMIGLQIQLDMATNHDEYDAFLKKQKEGKEKISSANVVRLNIPSEKIVSKFFADEVFDDFYSSAIKSKTCGKRTVRFATFPAYLVIQLRKFAIGDDWIPKKFDVSVDMPEELDLSGFRATGLQQGEELLPDGDDNKNDDKGVTINEEFVSQLLEMGFPLEACKKAVYHTNNQGVEPAMNWVFEHSQDPDFASPLQLPNSSNKSEAVNEEAVAMITSMGFTELQAKKALKKNNNNLEAAAEWIFSHMDELNSMEVDEPTSSETQNAFKDGIGKYSLFGFISHMGTSSSCGHYVCHIKKNDKWVIYNDRKVAMSETPPKNLGYLYFYKRKSS